MNAETHLRKLAKVGESRDGTASDPQLSKSEEGKDDSISHHAPIVRERVTYSAAEVREESCTVAVPPRV